MAAGRLRPARPCGGTAADAPCEPSPGPLVGGGGPAAPGTGTPDPSPRWPATRSDGEQLGFLVLEDVVDGVGVLLGGGVELLLRSGDLVLADLLVLHHLVQSVLGRAAGAANRDPGVLGLVLGQLDVLLTPLLGELGQGHADRLAVVGGVDAEVGVADRLLD